MPVKPRPVTIPVNHAREAVPVRIVADGAISTGIVGDGRMLPVLILDATERPDIHAFIAMQRDSEAGDVHVQWGQLPDYTDTIALILSFQRPVELKAIVKFELARNHGFLVEQILAMHGVYMQAGKEGDRMKTTMDHPRVIVEIPDTGFRAMWDKMYLEFTVRALRERGLSRQRARVAAREVIEQLREFGEFRLPTS